MNRKLNPIVKYALIGVAAIVGFALISTVAFGWTVVDDGERGVYTRTGEVQGTVGPGFHLMIPFVDNIQTYEVRTKSYTMSGQSGEGDKAARDDSIESLTQEGLNVDVDMTVRYHYSPDKVDYLYKNVSKTEDGVTRDVVRPTAREAIRGCSSQYSIEGIYSSNRDNFSQCVSDRIKTQYTQKGLTVEAVQIRNIMLPQKVRNAIQDKQSAEESIQTKQKELEIEELEAERKRTEAQGIRDSQQIINETLTQQYLSYLWITEGIEKGDTIYVPMGNNGMEMFKDVDKTDVGNSTNSSS